MEVQDFAPRHLVAQFAFKKHQPEVIDRRGSLAAELHEFLGPSTASLDATAVEAQTRDGMDQYRIGIAQLLAILNVDGFDEGTEKVQGFFGRGMELLGAPPLSRVVAHTSDIAAVPSLEALRDALLNGLSSDASPLRDAVGAPLADAVWSFDFKDDQRTVEVRINPTDDEELHDIFEAPDTVVFPAAALFLDVKVVLRVGDSSKDPLELWLSALKQNRQITTNLTAWLREAVHGS